MKIQWVRIVLKATYSLEVLFFLKKKFGLMFNPKFIFSDVTSFLRQNVYGLKKYIDACFEVIRTELIGKSTKHLPGIIYFMKAIQWNSHIMESLDWIINMLSLIDFLYLFNTFYRICSITKVCRCISVNEQRNPMISFPLLYMPHILSQVNFIKLGFLIKILSNLNIA